MQPATGALDQVIAWANRTGLVRLAAHLDRHRDVYKPIEADMLARIPDAERAVTEAQLGLVAGRRPATLPAAFTAAPKPSAPARPPERLWIVASGATRLYFIGQDNDEGPIKIGVSRHPERRLSQVQTGHPFKLRIYLEVPALLRAEATLHRWLDAYRLNGEWFERGAALVALAHVRNLAEAARSEMCAERAR